MRVSRHDAKWDFPIDVPWGRRRRQPPPVSSPSYYNPSPSYWSPSPSYHPPTPSWTPPSYYNPSPSYWSPSPSYYPSPSYSAPSPSYNPSTCPDFAMGPDSDGDCLCRSNQFCSRSNGAARDCPTSGGIANWGGYYFLPNCTDCRCYSRNA